MKPIIFITGVTHSCTSMVAKFLLDNGAYLGENHKSKASGVLKYPTYEDITLKKYEMAKRKFHLVGKKKIVDYINGFPLDRVAVLKQPLIAWWLPDIIEGIKRPVKIVWAIRNPRDVIASTLEKGGHSFIWAFERYCEFYGTMANYEWNVLPFVVERIEIDAIDLLDFCELEYQDIDFSGIQEPKNKSVTYTEHRFKSFWWKKLSRFFDITVSRK